MNNLSDGDLEALRREYQNLRLKRNIETIKICSTDRYLLWLKNYTRSHIYFRSDDWSLQTKNNSLQDRENVNKLGLLYEGIEDYAEQSGLYPKLTSYGNYYALLHQTAGYHVGRISTDVNSSYCCNRVSRTNLIHPIDFIDVKEFNQQKWRKTYQKTKK